jgi:hypothetical protein
MKVKGTAVETIPLFIKSKFGEQGFKRWLDAQTPTSHEIFRSSILASAWYPVKDGLIDPTLKFCELFYGGRMDGAIEQGRFSAEHGLKGVYRLFVRLASPETLVGKASTIMPTYYEGSAMEVIEKGNGAAKVRITRFETPHSVIEHRMKGWMERALEMSGAKSPKAEIAASMAKGSPHTDFLVSWK